MEGLHPGSFWRVLNPYPTPVEDLDNANLFPTASGQTVTEDEEDPAKLCFSEIFNGLQLKKS